MSFVCSKAGRGGVGGPPKAAQKTMAAAVKTSALHRTAVSGRCSSLSAER